MNLQFVQSIFRIPDTFCQMVFGSLFCITKHLLELNTTILPIFAIIPIDNIFFMRLGSQRTSTIDVIFSKVEENFILPFFIHTMKLANFTFYIVVEFSKHLKLYLFLNTRLVAPKSKYQQSTRLLLLLVSNWPLLFQQNPYFLQNILFSFFLHNIHSLFKL